MKKKAFLFVTSFVFLWWTFSFAPTYTENTCVNQNTLLDSYGTSTSYAWNGDRFYVLSHFVSDNTDADKAVYSLASRLICYKIENGTLQEQISSENISNFGIFLMDSRQLYMACLSPSYMGNFNPQPDPSIELYSVSHDGEIQKAAVFSMKDIVQDILIYQGEIYVLTNDKVIVLNPQDAGGEQIIYRACDNLLNDLFYNHAIIESGVLYLQDGDRLIALGLSDSSSTYICDIPFYLDFSLHVPKGNYCYVILDGVAYFWDTVHRQMVSVDIETKRESTVSQDCYLFLQLSPTGAIVSIIPHSVLEDFLDGDTVDSWDQIQICFTSALPDETDGLFHGGNSVMLNSLDYVLIENGYIIDVSRIS